MTEETFKQKILQEDQNYRPQRKLMFSRVSVHRGVPSHATWDRSHGTVPLLPDIRHQAQPYTYPRYRHLVVVIETRTVGKRTRYSLSIVIFYLFILVKKKFDRSDWLSLIRIVRVHGIFFN